MPPQFSGVGGMTSGLVCRRRAFRPVRSYSDSFLEHARKPTASCGCGYYINGATEYFLKCHFKFDMVKKRSVRQKLGHKIIIAGLGVFAPRYRSDKSERVRFMT